MATTIQVAQDVKKMLDELKAHPKESYNMLIKRLLQSKTDQEALSEETIQNIERGLEDIKAGRVYSTSEVKKRLRIK
jgi:predicted transcriptional regulator